MPSTRGPPRWACRRSSRTRTGGRPTSSRGSASRTSREGRLMFDWQFFALLMSNGVLIGLMYALIALGFVLVYKATDVINFAQGEFVMIAGFVAAGALGAWGAPLWLSVVVGLGAMVGFGFSLERVMLRRLIGRPVIAIVMATIGLAAILRGLGPLAWGAETKPLPLPISDEPFMLGPLFIPPIQLLGAVVSLGFLA